MAELRPLEFASGFPAVLPFPLVDDLHLEFRVSDALLIGLLFVVDWRAAGDTLVPAA